MFVRPRGAPYDQERQGSLARQIPFQMNDGGLVALLPDGHVEFLAAPAREMILRHNAGSPVSSTELMSHVLTDPLVELERFHPSAPAIAFVETTNLCNLRCRRCYADSALKRPDEISTPRIKRLLDDFADMGVLQVFLTGGEIFSHRDAGEIIRHARRKPFSTQIFTNGLLSTEERLAEIPAGQSFFISFDTRPPSPHHRVPPRSRRASTTTCRPASPAATCPCGSPATRSHRWSRSTASRSPTGTRPRSCARAYRSH
ncbi:radical SAM protein [Streptomyces sp. NBC_01283]|uniref:radical SAM protein n=1 Tax=Streptomyces sp. NBC_01283 TaxID=2903812 RepID=UPI00352F9F95|nr:radical SAM protein [Streptomyces sp. NBC_01283]